MENKQETGFDLSSLFGIKASGIVNHQTLGYQLNSVFQNVANIGLQGPTVAPQGPANHI